jgi:hypothetical protein
MALIVNLLDKYIFSGIPSNAAWDLIKIAWEKASQKSWEELYLDAFQAATEEAQLRLAAYVEEGQVTVDRSALSKALHHDLGAAVDTLPFSRLSSDKFARKLAGAMAAHSVLIIGGHNLSTDDYAQLVRNLIRQANARFTAAILANESAFRRALLDEALTNQALVRDVEAYLADQCGLVMGRLDVIENKVDAQVGLMQQMAADVQDVRCRSTNGPQFAPLRGSGRTRTKVRVFVASPGDVLDERRRLARVVEQLNRGLADWLGLTLELLRWETHVAPDTGRPQRVVFDQLPPEDWDIFVGIIWLRFGSDTGDTDPDTGQPYRSGTEEEFKAAYRRRQESTTGWPKVMFYRCIRNPENVLYFDDPENAAQFARVQEFFGGFAPAGPHPGLVHTYTQPEEFERTVREHLETCLRDLAGARPHVRAGEPEQTKPIGGIPPRVHTLPPVNREPELSLFRRILRGETAVRGLVIHSRGEGGWGKSVLLQMFERECATCRAPTTEVFSFDPSNIRADWRSIMDRTARALGTEYFPRYFGTSATVYSREVKQRPVERVSSISGSPQDIGEAGGVVARRPVYAARRPEQLQLNATEVFLEELQAVPVPAQIVWLVDAVDWIDRDTQAWLIKIFGRIASGGLAKVILVVAGRDSLYYHPSWKGSVEKLDVCRFDKSAIPELLVLTGWIPHIEENERICEAISEDLIRKTNGRPLDICTLLQHGRPGWEV